MDLIDLYHRRGVSLVRSRLRADAGARRGYFRLAKRYAEQIERMREDRTLEVVRLTSAL
jgi:hypothetical protein